MGEGMSQQAEPALAVIIPTVNRAPVLHDTILSVLRQSCLPGQILVSSPGAEHILDKTRELPRVKAVQSPVGANLQRNRAVDALTGDVEFVIFLDDDVELREDYFATMLRMFRDHPEVVLADGHVLADGVSRERAREIVAADQRRHSGGADEPLALHPTTVAYGCNMNVRRTALQAARFDERLVLYAMMDDLDFSAQCLRHGSVVRCENSRMVHLAHSSGRMPARWIGFAQMMYPTYLWRKGTLPTRHFLVRTSRWLLANAVYALWRDRGMDRRNRLRGNLQALVSILRGRIAPEEILRISAGS
jgi:GT2 family glycosyltransferase